MLKDIADREIFHLHLRGIRDASAATERSKSGPLRRLAEEVLVDEVIDAYLDGITRILVETEMIAGKQGFGVD